MDAETLKFFESVRLGQRPESLIEPLLRAELPRIMAQNWGQQRPGICLLSDIGEYLVRILDIISQLANSIVINGSYIRDLASNRVSKLLDEHDLHTTDYLDDKHAALKSITTEVSKATIICKTIWAETPPAPVAPTLLQTGLESLPYEEYTLRPSHQSMQAQSHPNSGGWQSPGSADHDQSVYSPGQSDADAEPNYSNHGQLPEVPSLEKLKQRGKGSYTCPHGTQCNKGGVDKDGKLRRFSRNSDFRAHLLRHDKIYKCDLPGCTNTKGFARPDQLERHKQLVKHTAPGWIPETPQMQYEQG